MSAYMVPKAHINALVNAGLKFGRRLRFGAMDNRQELTANTADQVGQMLVDANVASIYARYPDTDPAKGGIPGNMPGPTVQYWKAPYRFPATIGPNFSPVEMLVALRGYEYQACEFAGWAESDAFSYCQALRLALISALPGYDDGPWEIDDDTQPARARSNERAVKLAGKNVDLAGIQARAKALGLPDDFAATVVDALGLGGAQS